jgi:transcriptional regulator with XRE-family HTH domain
LRTARKLSQEKLSEMCGTHRNFVGVIERAEKSPGFIHILRLSVGLNMKPMDLFKTVPKLTLEDLPKQKKKKKAEK